MNPNLVRKLKQASCFALIAMGLLTACVPAATQTVAVQSPLLTETRDSTPGAPTDTFAPPPSETPDQVPTDAEKPAEEDFSNFVFVPLLPFDGIRPVYNPEFVGVDESPLHPDELIMGVSIQGESKAYPVSVLRFREMVDDELGGLPILVTW